jgi:hypothetical protein
MNEGTGGNGKAFHKQQLQLESGYCKMQTI